MEVYLEVAFLENFLLDGVLLYLALVCARVKPSVPRLLTASALGAVEAIVFPPCRLPGAAAYFVKIAGGLLLIAVAVPGKRFRPYWMTAAAFFLLTFALGGLLTAAYSFFGISYAETGGYLVEQAPVGLIVGATVAFFAAVCSGARAMYRYRRTEKNVLPCKLKAGTRGYRQPSVLQRRAGVRHLGGRRIRALRPGSARSGAHLRRDGQRQAGGSRLFLRQPVDFGARTDDRAGKCLSDGGRSREKLPTHSQYRTHGGVI